MLTPLSLSYADPDFRLDNENFMYQYPFYAKYSPFRL